MRETSKTIVKNTSPKAQLPKELFGQKPNINLLSQAYYVSQARAHRGTHKTKTRAQVAGTGAKVYRQKGTGRARHGSRKAPIYVGGGIVFGPRGEKRTKVLSKSLIRASLISALSARNAQNKVFVVDGKNFSGKTKTTSKLLEKLVVKGKMLVLHGGEREVVRASRNILNVTVLPANQVNAYVVVNNQNLVVTREGLRVLQETFGKKAAK